MSLDPVDALLLAVKAAPDSGPVRLALVEAMAEHERLDEALPHVRILLDQQGMDGEQAVQLGHAAVEQQQLAMAEILLQYAWERGVVQGLSDLEGAVQRARASRSKVSVAAEGGDDAPQVLSPPAAMTQIKFKDVGGLAGLKKTIHRKIVLPFSRPELLAQYGKKAGGGVLLYGPPGCGKTLLARATAGEVGCEVFVLRIEDVLSRWLGETEQALHNAFEYARQQAPCVMFLDELDAIAFSRSRAEGAHHRTMVDQLLQELDGFAQDNHNVLVIGATNAPWDLDDALLRPGRFDRTIFVPPPDKEARSSILRLHLNDRLHEGIDFEALAEMTEVYSGADLMGLVEDAADQALEAALSSVSGTNPPITQAMLLAAIDNRHPSTTAWLERARNYVDFANQDGRFDEIGVYLGKPKPKRGGWLSWLRGKR